MINLLPSQQKKEIEREKIWKLILILGIIVVIFFLAIFLIVLAIQIYLFGQVESQKILFEVERKRLENPEFKDIQREIVALNQSILELDSFYQNQKMITDILEKLSEAIPPGIYLTNFSWQKENAEFKILGFAPQREDLFKLKENLEKEKSFSDIDFPPANWVKPKEINFQIFFKIPD